MLSQSQIKRFKSLHQKKYRQQEGKILLEGHRLIQQALMADVKINGIWITEYYIESPSGKKLSQLFKEKNIASYFEGGIYGSPSSKYEIVEERLKDKNFLPALFLGDSLYDIQTAQKYNLDFIFVYGWTDLDDWKRICDKNQLTYIEKIEDLI